MESAKVRMISMGLVWTFSVMLWGASAFTTVTTLSSARKPRSTWRGSHGFAASCSAMQ